MSDETMVQLEYGGRSVETSAERMAAVADAIGDATRTAHLSADPLDRSLGDDQLYPYPRGMRFVDQATKREHEYIDAPDLAEIAGDLIAQYDDLDPAQHFAIDYLWKREGGKSKGAATLGKTVKLSGTAAYYSGFDFTIWLAADHAFAYQFTRLQIEALLFHELCHVGTQDADEIKPALYPHDAEVFRAELQHYGFWCGGLRRTFGQLEMPL